MIMLSIYLCVSASAAEEFTAEDFELSSSSSKNIVYHVKPDADTTFWAMNFTLSFDTDILTLQEITADPRFQLYYTINGGSCTVFLYAIQPENVVLEKADSLVSISFLVSENIQPGEYSFKILPSNVSMVTYSGVIKDAHFKGGSFFYGNRITYISNGKTISSEFASTGDVIRPVSSFASENPDEIFIGWYSAKNSEHEKIFTAPGESFALGNHDVVLEAVYLEFKTLPGASIYFANESNDIRLRFVSAVNKKQYDFIYKEILGSEPSSLILGTLICPTSYAEQNSSDSLNGGMDFDALKSDSSAVQTSVPMAPGDWLSKSEVAVIGGSSDYYYYEGVLNNILRKTAREGEDEIINYDTPFSAVAYLTLTYPSGKAVDHFAKYSPESHSRTVRYVVEQALADTSPVETSHYRFKIDDVYRPYSSSQLQALYRIQAGM